MVGRRARLRIDIGRFYTECLGWHRITLDNLTVIWIHALIRLFKLCRDSADFWSAERGTNRVPEVGHIMFLESKRVPRELDNTDLGNHLQL